MKNSRHQFYLRKIYLFYENSFSDINSTFTENVSCGSGKRAPGCDHCTKYDDGNKEIGIHNSCRGWCYIDKINQKCTEKGRYKSFLAILTNISLPIQDHRIKCSKYYLVSVNIKIRTGTDAHLLKWSLGACSNSKEYTNDKEFVEEGCYLAPGKHTLNCCNIKQPYGWKKGFIVINGHRFCDDFMGYKALRHIFISSTYFYLY